MKQVDTIILVENIEESKKFYIDIMGLEVFHDWKSMVIFKNRLAIHQGNLLLPREFANQRIKKGIQGNDNLIIYIELTKEESLDNFYNYLKKMDIEIIHEIVKLPWQRIFRIYDPDKHIIEIGEPTIE